MYPGKKVLRHTGFLKDQKGIINRYLREKPNWDSHLNNCKRFIRESLSKHSFESVAVLGSGFLLDVPVDFLIQKCSSVYLIDVHHPPEITNRFKTHSGVHFIEDDLTGNGIEMVYNSSKGFWKMNKPVLSSLEIKPYAFPSEINPDVVISLNLLNQLDILLSDYLIRKFRYEDKEINQFRKRIQEAHLAFLLRQPSLLITDETECYIRPDNKDIVDKKPLVFTNLPEERISDSWNWTFDTMQRYHPDFNITFIVRAFNLLNHEG